MADNRYTLEQIAAGEIELEQVLGKFAKIGLTKASVGGKKRSKFPYSPTNLAALIIHRRNGGWVASEDVV